MSDRFWVLLLLLSLCACAPARPILFVKEPVWDLGAIVTNSKNEKVVELVNNGNKPLLIEKVEECCGFYGQVELPLTIPPQGHVPMKLLVNPFKMIGDLDVKLTVVSNDPQQPRFLLKAIGQVVPKIYALAELDNLPGRKIDLGLLEAGSITPFALRIDNPGNAPLTLRYLEKSGAILEAKSLDAIPGNGTGVWSFTYAASAPGPVEEMLVINTNDALHRSLSVQLRGYVVPRDDGRHGLLISPVGTKAVYDVGKKIYRYDFLLRNQGAGRVAFARGSETLPALILDLPEALEPGEERAASAVLPIAPNGGTLELRLFLPFVIQ